MATPIVVPSVTKVLSAMCKSPAAQAIQRARWALPAESLARRDAVLDFWFGAGKWQPLNPPAPDTQEIPENFDLWFGGTEEIDKEITDKFKTDVEKAIRGEYKAWQFESPYSLLALIILLDQYALNIYRDLPEGYHTAELAIPLSYTAMGRGWIEQVPPNMRMFFTLPLTHSELLVDQCVSKSIDPTGECTLAHHEAISRYGRFPGRNKVHKRENTEDDEAYLKDGGIF